MTERMGLAAVGRQNRQRAALARRAELRPAARRLAAVAVGFAGGWAVLYGALMPFGLGFALGFAEDCFAPCAAGAALGVLLHGFGALSLRSVCMLCALGAAVAARWMGARTLTPAALAGCGTLVGVALCFAFGGGGAELVFYSAADALLAAAMGFCLRQFAPEKPGAGMLLVGAAAAAALGSVQLWQLLPGVIVCAALELYLCSKGQAKAALAACAVLGAALCAADPALSFAASGLACATVAAAVLAPGRRMETVAAYAGGCVTGALCVQPPGSAFQYLLNVCIGITAVAVMPAAWLVPEPEEKPQAGQAQPQQYSAAATRLEQVSQSLASLAETVNDVYETLPHRREDFHWVIDNTHDTLCFNCGRRDTCWKQEYAATLEGMEALRPLLESSGGLETAQLPGQLSRCIHPAALCAAANRSFALYRSRKEARLHAEAMRTALTEQYSAVAEALGVHVSTVSRAIAEHFAEENRSTLPVRNFKALPGSGTQGVIDGSLFFLTNLTWLNSRGSVTPDVTAAFDAAHAKGQTAVALSDMFGVVAVFAVADTLKSNSAQAIALMKKVGLTPWLLTGDNARAAEAIAQKVGIDNVKADLLPEHKLEVIEELESKAPTAMVGDGINDAPALSRARIGFAMGIKGADTAIEAADVAIMDDNIAKIAWFKKLSELTHSTLIQNIVFALGVKFCFMIAALAGYATMWMAVFADTGVCLIVVAWGLRLMRSAGKVDRMLSA